MLRFENNNNGYTFISLLRFNNTFNIINTLDTRSLQSSIDNILFMMYNKDKEKKKDT